MLQDCSTAWIPCALLPKDCFASLNIQGRESCVLLSSSLMLKPYELIRILYILISACSTRPKQLLTGTENPAFTMDSHVGYVRVSCEPFVQM